MVYDIVLTIQSKLIFLNISALIHVLVDNCIPVSVFEQDITIETSYHCFNII